MRCTVCLLEIRGRLDQPHDLLGRQDLRQALRLARPWDGELGILALERHAILELGNNPMVSNTFP